MKKLLFPVVALCFGALLSAGIGKFTSQARAMAAQYHQKSEQLTNLVNELSEARNQLRHENHNPDIELKQPSQRPQADPRLLNFVSKCQTPNWNGAVSPEIREALGISWVNSPDYILLTKSALEQVYYFSGIDRRTGALDPLLCDILGLSPEEQRGVEAVSQRALNANEEWLRTKIEKVKSSGDILAEYRVPANPELTKSLKSDKESLGQLLGSQRTELLKKFSLGFFLSNGCFGERQQRFTVRHTPTRQPPLWFCVEYAGGSTSGDVTPEDFPDQYRSAFPGGWRQVAQANGFVLPENFSTQTP